MIVVSRATQLYPVKTANRIITTIDILCRALDIPVEELEAVLLIPAEEKYSSQERRKKDGSIRVVHNPHHRLRRIQRRLNKRLFSNQDFISWPDHIFGSIPNQKFEDGEHPKDYVACARVHCGAKSILTLDIENFFGNIHINQVLKVFTELLQFSPEVADIVAQICCHKEYLIQGALTSSYIAGLILFDVEGKVVERLSRKNLRYTRLVDDINVSSIVSDYNFGYAKTIIEEMLIGKDLPVNHSKTRIQYCSTLPLTVHGLRVGFKEPRLPSDEVRKIRAAVHAIEVMAKEPNYRTTHAYRRDFNRCMGRVNKLSRVGHNQYENLLPRLQKIYPLPSQKDIERAIKIVTKLELDCPTKLGTFWFAKRFYLAHERLNILQRSFPTVAYDLRARLKPMKTPYD
ncbi:reverse transcriptase family protein [Massilia sp. erpn]|uniref:reverse transcriptase family protein n=1 Tax=Massilia sp. erpn TaxID=2738142 RepID=UPI002106890B|nr:reverse transcriptase family protein [Massilia sp. erpn]UTY57698.1 RNA-directed DNA polymerase [Massilia sp. erpn]